MTRRRLSHVLGAAAATLILLPGVLAARSYLGGETGDFIHFYDAATGMLAGEHLYEYQGLETEMSWFMYLPLFAVMLAPLALLPFALAGAAWALINTAMLALLVWLGARECLRRLPIEHDAALLAGVMTVSMLPLMDKLRTELDLGQSDILVGLCMVLGLVWADRRPILAGLALGVATNVKLQGLVFLPYLLVRRRWAQAASLVASSAAFMLGGALFWGWERNLDYLRISLGGVAGLLGLGAAPEGTEVWGLTWNRSVSIPSCAARLAETLGLGSGALLAMVAVAAGAMFAVGWWMYARRGSALFVGRTVRSDESGPARGLVLLEWIGLMVAVLVLSPQASPRHLVPLLVLCAAAAALALTAQRVKERGLLIGALVLFGAGLVLPPGGAAFGSAVEAWRAIGGPMWFVVLLYFTVLWFGLGRIGADQPLLGAMEDADDGAADGQRDARHD